MAVVREIVGCAGPVLLVACILAWLLKPWRVRRVVPALIVFAAGWVPVGELAVFFHLRGLIGELAVPTVVLLVGTLIGRDRVVTSDSRGALLCFGFVAGLLLYPFAMGVSPVDPYAWGHQLALPLLLLPLTLLFRLRGHHQAAYVLVAAVLAFHLRLLTSDNLWDYVLDPVLLFWGCGWAVSAWRNRPSA